MMIIKKLRCLITGGHRYSSANLLTMKDHFKREYIFTNNCLKCGKIMHIRISKVALERILAADLEAVTKITGKALLDLKKKDDAVHKGENQGGMCEK